MSSFHLVWLPSEWLWIKYCLALRVVLNWKSRYFWLRPWLQRTNLECVFVWLGKKTNLVEQRQSSDGEGWLNLR